MGLVEEGIRMSEKIAYVSNSCQDHERAVRLAKTVQLRETQVSQAGYPESAGNVPARKRIIQDGAE